MSSRMKEEERIEKIIRGLLKLPENKRCINCNILGPQYVCTTFSTFVCTNCSGIHREFTHRVKSVSMAKFTAEEVSGLQAGGNERARQIYFKTWDPHRNSLPDGSNLHRLRDFVKHVYVDQKYSGERSFDKPSTSNVGVDDDSFERRPFEQSSRGARDNSLERHSLERTTLGGRDDFHERPSIEKSNPSIRKDDRNLGYYIEEGRSPRYRQQTVKTVKPRSHKTRVARFEIVDDRFREDSVGGARRFESLKYSGSRAGSRSPESQRRREMPGLPDVRPVREILGDKVPRLMVAESVKSNDEKDSDGSAHGQKSASSTTSPQSVNEKAKETQPVNSPRPMNEKGKETQPVQATSLIDFDDTPEAPASTKAQQTMQMTLYNDGSTGSEPPTTTEKASTASSLNPLELLLFDLSAPTVATSEVSAGGDAPSAVTNNVNAMVAGSVVNAQVATGNTGAPAASPIESNRETYNITNSMVNLADVQQCNSIQHNQPSSTHAGISSSTAQQSIVPFDVQWSSEPAANSQGPTASDSSQRSIVPLDVQWSSEPAASSQGPPANDSSQKSIVPFDVQWSSEPTANSQGPPANDSSRPFPQAASEQGRDTSSINESKSSARKELPADLFVSSYPSFATPVQGWQYPQAHGMGYGVQYHPMAMSTASFAPPGKSRNPFDIADDSPQVQAPMFPSMSSLQGALPNMAGPTGLQIQASSYAVSIPPLPSSYGMVMPPGQQLPNSILVPRPQGANSFGNADAFASLNPIQQSAASYQAPSNTSYPASRGGNPFG